MSSFDQVQQKLEQFIKKYYLNSLLKGIILFAAIGLLYLIVTLLVEHWLWLDVSGRTVLFWVFILVELGLFVRLILYPLLQLFNLRKGIEKEEAARIIGDHFPEVSDKLLNVIQLQQSSAQDSELLLASINQKSSELRPIPFRKAIDLKANLKYTKYLAIPAVIIALFAALGQMNVFSDSYERVVNYDLAYEPPAPFSFVLGNDGLKAIENQDFVLQVRTVGEVVPENVRVIFDDQQYVMIEKAPGNYEYTFLQPARPINFKLVAGEVESPVYELNVVQTPSILGFNMFLDYPEYTQKRDETLSSSGNATIPEGTKVNWQINTRNTERINLILPDTSFAFNKEEALFNAARPFYRTTDYSVSTSNSQLSDFEQLSFTLNVIKDQYPEIQVQTRIDSMDSQRIYHLGQVNDDYGLTALNLVYYPSGQLKASQKETIAIGKGSFDQFAFVFPGDLILQGGTAYEYYFEVTDNDQVNRFKSTRSDVFSFRKLTEDEIKAEQLESQQQNIEGLDKTLDELKEQEKILQELSRVQKEKENLNWNDRQKLEQFLQRQQAQEQMMKNFSKELKEDLQEFNPEEQNDPFKKELEDRLEENEKRMEENEELLKELERLQDKIQKEELTEKLEQLAKQNKNQEKNLEQLVELTKRYYVAKKAEKLAEDIMKLGMEQEDLGKKSEEENSLEKQQELNEQFEDYMEQMEELRKENQELKSPMEVGEDKTGEKVVEQEQQKATEQLQQQNPQSASPSQQKAGKRMQQMGSQMQMQMMGGQMETMNEDIEMLRQILDNLIVFSFEQESLMEEFKTIEYGNAVFGKKLNVQNDLKQNFKHVDDSLFALSLRQPMIAEPITESITEVQFNMDKALERLAENEIRQGIGSQQYTVTGANELAILLSELLNSMQNQANAMGMGQGQGNSQGRGFQLPDIIKKQESLNQQMQEGTEKGEQQGQGQEGESGGEGEQGEGEQGEGQQGENGQSGSKGQDGQQNGEGNKGMNGEGSDSEGMNGELYEIYKQQQMLRKEFEDRLGKAGLKGKAGELVKEMEGIEQQLLDKGFDSRTLERMLNLKYEMLKLDEAAFEQGQEQRREANTNKEDFTNTRRTDPEELKKYFNQTEILTRDPLPLREKYKEKVKQYFTRDND